MLVVSVNKRVIQLELHDFLIRMFTLQLLHHFLEGHRQTWLNSESSSESVSKSKVSVWGSVSLVSS